jgi:transcription initiation factor TFIIB
MSHGGITDNDMFDFIDNIDDVNGDCGEVVDQDDPTKSQCDTTESDKIKNNYNEICKLCEKDTLYKDYSAGHVVCSYCGAVNNAMSNGDAKWDLYDTKDSISRFGCPTNFFFPKSSLGTSIRMSKWSRINRINNWGNMTYKERSLYKVLQEIDEICKKHGIKKSIIDNAKIVYKRIRDSKHLVGKNKGKNIIMRKKNRKRIIAACVFYGAKLQKNDRDVKEVAKIFGMSTKQVNKGCSAFYKILKKNVDNEVILKNLKSTKAAKFIISFAKKLKIEEEYMDIAVTMSNNIDKLGVASNHKPLSVAATCIVLVSNMYGLSISKYEVSEIFGISEATLSKIYMKINKFRNVLIDDDKTDLLLEKIKQLSKIQRVSKTVTQI